jgi:hypothetical protein
MQASECKHVWCLNDNAKFGVWFNCEKCGQKKRPNYLNELEAALREAQAKIKEMLITFFDKQQELQRSQARERELHDIIDYKDNRIADLEQAEVRERVLQAKIDELEYESLENLKLGNRALIREQELHSNTKGRERVLREAIKKAVSMFISTEISGSGSGNFVDEFEQGVCGLLEEALSQEGKA